MADAAEKTATPARDAGDQYATTQLFEPAEDFSRQEEDIALAAELLKSGLANEREIAAAVSGWSMHGNVPLRRHLEEQGLLVEKQLDQVMARAQDRIGKARRSVAGGSEVPGSGQSMLLATLERLDGSGRVAKLFGVTVAASSGDQAARIVEGRYELMRKIGQGGLGRVWLARDVNLGRYVALKEISHQASASELIIKRFRHEAKITGRLDHPCIVPIYQLGQDRSSGRVFYTMRFLGRSTLQDSIAEYHERREQGDDNPMLLRSLLNSFVSVCHAIGHAHSRQVIHRDLKPDNIVIDSFGQVIVIDWGLAKIIDEAAVESVMDAMVAGTGDCTSDGQVLGTPLYMAPEQAAGRLDELDHRTDIYGLGAILFSIVTGYAPHEKTQKLAIDSGAGGRGMISAIANGEAPLASDVLEGVDPALESICRQAMARRHYARYQSASELAEDVQHWLAGAPVNAHRETPWQRANRWVSRHRRVSQALLGLAMVALVAMTTLAMSARQRHQAERSARFARMEADLREVSLQLKDLALELAQDARFVASLPPIQGIVNARSGVDGDDEAVWRDRLETILTGMLRSNPAYLAISFEAVEGDNTIDLTRVERNVWAPSLIQPLPVSRLQTVQEDSLMKGVSLLAPSDVRLSLDKRARHADRATAADHLSVATPVYSDVSGDFFGMAVIETDVSAEISSVLTALGAVDCEIFVADGSGRLWATADAQQGVRLQQGNRAIPDLPATVAERLTEDTESFEIERQGEYIAERFYVDRAGRGLTLFARLRDN